MNEPVQQFMLGILIFMIGQFITGAILAYRIIKLEKLLDDYFDSILLHDLRNGDEPAVEYGYQTEAGEGETL